MQAKLCYCLLFLLLPNAIVSQTFVTFPLSEPGSQPRDVIGREGEDVSLFCQVNVTTGQSQGQVLTVWQYKNRTSGPMFESVTFSGVNDIITDPDFLLNKIVVDGDPLSGNVTFRTNFTFLNFTDEFDLIVFACGPPDQDMRQFRLGLPVVPSLLINVPVQTVTEGEDITVPLQSGPPNAFPPTITSSQLSINRNPVSNAGVTVNDYTVSFTNVQRNQSGIYTLTVSNDAGTSNTTFTLDVQFPPEATSIGTDIQYVESGGSVTVSLFNNINGNPTPTVSWTGPNGQIMSNEGRFTVDNVTGTLSITDFTSADNGTYTSTVSNTVGSINNTIDLILAVPPGPPIGLTADDITDTNVTLSWSPPTDIGTPPFNYYRINMSPAPPPDVILNTTSTSLRVWGIIPGTDYTVSVVAVTINDALNVSLVGDSSNITTFRTMIGAPMFQNVSATAENGFINVSWTFRHTGGQEIDDVEVLCSTSGEGSSGGLYDMLSCDMMNDCSNSNLMGSTRVGPITAGLSYSCRITAINANGTDVRNIDNIVPVEGIPSSPVITGTVTSPGVLVLRVRTMYPGDTNIRFIVNTTNTSGGSINSTHEFNDYEANSIVNISINIPNGGSVSVSIVTINQYGSSDVLNYPQVFTIDPTSTTTSTASSTTSTAGSSTPSVTAPSASMTPTMSVVMSSTPVPTGSNTPATVGRSGLSAGAIAGIIIAVIILFAVIVLIVLIVFYVYYKNRGGSYQVDRPSKKGGVTVEELDIDIGTELQDKSTEQPKTSEAKPPELHYADLADFTRKPQTAAAAADKPEGSVTKPAPIEEVQYAQIKPQAKPKDDTPNPASDIL